MTTRTSAGRPGEPLGSSPAVTRAAPPAAEPRAAPRLTVLAGLRGYAESLHPMFQLAGDVDLRVVAVGLTAALGAELAPTSNDPSFQGEFGRFTPYLAAVTARRQLACAQSRRLALCLHARLEGGLSGLRVTQVSPGIMATSTSAPYALGAVALEGRRRLPGVDLGLWLELGWARGFVARGLGTVVASFDGAVGMVNLGIGWPR